MQHILADGVIDYDRYALYLETVRDRLPPHVWEFVATPARFQLNGPETLHDSWLESLRLDEPSSGACKDTRASKVTLRLLHATHDSIHVLRYDGVTALRLDAPAIGHGHGDLITHEVRLATDNSSLIHELLFQGPAGGIKRTVQIECDDLHYEQAPSGPNPNGPAG